MIEKTENLNCNNNKLKPTPKIINSHWSEPKKINMGLYISHVYILFIFIFLFI